MPSSAGGWRGQGSPGGDERSEHALDAAERRRNRSCGPPSTRIRPDRVPSSRRAGSVNAEPAPPGSLTRSARHVAMRRTPPLTRGQPTEPEAKEADCRVERHVRHRALRRLYCRILAVMSGSASELRSEGVETRKGGVPSIRRKNLGRVNAE